MSDLSLRAMERRATAGDKAAYLAWRDAALRAGLLDVYPSPAGPRCGACELEGVNCINASHPRLISVFGELGPSNLLEFRHMSRTWQRPVIVGNPIPLKENERFTVQIEHRWHHDDLVRVDMSSSMAGSILNRNLANPEGRERNA